MQRDAMEVRRSAGPMAQRLGWFSVALGVAELMAPRTVARLIGVAPTANACSVLRAYGARELGNGLAILAQPERSAWLWARVAGDAVDLATLSRAVGQESTSRGRTLAATLMVLGVTALDVVAAQQLTLIEEEDEVRSGRRSPRPAESTVRVAEAVTINHPLEQVKERWAQLDSLPESLRSLGKLQGENGEHADARGAVEFRAAPAGRGTEIRVELEYAPRGFVGTALANVFGGDPTGQLRQDLRRVKQIFETGEIVLSDGPALWRPARPAADRREIERAAGVEVTQ